MKDRKALAALEFALASPLLVLTLSGAADIGVAQYRRIAFAASLEATGAHIAKHCTPTNCNHDTVRNVLAHTLPSGVTLAPGEFINGPSAMCIVNGSLAAASLTFAPCADGTPPAYYMIVRGTITNSGILTAYFPASVTQSSAFRIPTP